MVKGLRGRRGFQFEQSFQEASCDVSHIYGFTVKIPTRKITYIFADFNNLNDLIIFSKYLKEYQMVR